MSGKVILLGAGPGDPALLTLKGKEYIEKADCIVYDRLASPELLSFAKKDCQLIYVGKANHHHTMKQEDINQLLYEMALNSEIVVRLKGGDPYVFGRGGEEALYLRERAIEVELVPGISSSIAALADAGIPITHRGLSKGFQVITAHSRKDAPAEIDYSQLLDPTVTYVFLMGLAHVGEIAKGLMEAGRSADTPAAVISNGTTAKQRKCIGCLNNIARLVEESGLESPAIIVVGQVVSLTNQLNFFESRPLFGKSFLVPFIERFRFSFSDGIVAEKLEEHFDSELEVKLRELGADVFSLKVGKITPLEIEKDKFLSALDSDWLIFSSQNGVNAFFWNLKRLGLDGRAIGRAKLAVIGNRTAQTLETAFLKADLVPKKQTGKALCNEIIERVSEGQKLTLFAAKESNPEIGKLLGDKYVFEKLVCYENKKEYSKKDYSEIDWENFDGVFFTSASSVRRTLEFTENHYPPKVYSIGPKCSEEIEAHIIADYIEAAQSNYEGLIELIVKTSTKRH